MKQLSIMFTFFLLLISATNAQISVQNITPYMEYARAVDQTDLAIFSSPENLNGKTVQIHSSSSGKYYAVLNPSGYIISEGWTENGQLSLPLSQSGPTNQIKLVIGMIGPWDESFENTIVFDSVGSNHTFINRWGKILKTNIPQNKNEVYLFPGQELVHKINLEMEDLLIPDQLTGISLEISITDLPSQNWSYLSDLLEDLSDDIKGSIEESGMGISNTFFNVNLDEIHREASIEMSFGVNGNLPLSSIGLWTSLRGLNLSNLENSRIWIDLSIRHFNPQYGVGNYTYYWYYDVLRNSGIWGDANGNGIVNSVDKDIVADANHWTSGRYEQLRNTVYNGPGEVNIGRAAGLYSFYSNLFDLDALHQHLAGGTSFSQLWAFGTPINGFLNSFKDAPTPEYTLNGNNLSFVNNADFVLIRGKLNGIEWSKTISSRGMQSIELPQGVKIESIEAKNIKSSPTSVENETVPTEFTLEQNYPNPFNPSTTISFSLPKTENVILKVYNITGQEVAELLNREMTAGKHEIVFNASNLASGIYIYKLQSGSFSSTKKMILMK